MKKTLTILLLSSALAAAQTPQTPPPPPQRTAPRNSQNHLQAVAAQLGLTPEQQAQAATIFANAQTTESTLRASLKTAQEGLNDAVKNNNTASSEQFSSTIASLKGQMTLAHSKTRSAFYQILTPEQRAKMDQLERQRWRGKRSGPRPNGQ